MKHENDLHTVLGSEVIHSRRLPGEATHIKLADGRELVLKGVPRQERSSRQPGQPWTELVALDSLGAEGAPVPRLVAADVGDGWLIRDYDPGQPLNELLATKKQPSSLFSTLVRDLLSIESACLTAADELGPFIVAHSSIDEVRGLAQGIEPLLLPGARSAWQDLINMALAPDTLSLGPVDNHPGNALWQGDRLIFIDFATVGLDFMERRIVAYSQLAYPTVASIITPHAYDHYRAVAGEQATLRLALFDLLFWGIVLSRLYALRAQPESGAAIALRAAWPDADALWEPAYAMWTRFRLANATITTIGKGLQFPAS